jgi:helicase MOV-10
MEILPRISLFLRLPIPFLVERRPSILVGDYILVMHSGANDGKWYEGRVHEIGVNDIKLRFSDDFSLYRGSEVDVQFVLNRLPFRRMHQGLAVSFSPSRVLFPEIDHAWTSPVPPETEMTFVNRAIGQNLEQAGAVNAILRQPPGSLPFIIFGP